MLETMIAKYCGPALAGIKPGNLVACSKKKFPSLKSELERLRNELDAAGICIEVLCECDKRAVIFVYRGRQLKEYLERNDIKALLRGFGYVEYSGISGCLKRLKQRMCKGEFPHEIGAFLGYPAADIDGFINHREKGCLLVGEWRVYENAERAKALFERYKKCRCAILKRMESGKTLAQIFCAA